MNLEIAKYNTKDIEIDIKFNGIIDKINFVVEDCQKNLMFKKSLNNGITVLEGNKYLLSILPNDTKDMNTLLTYTYFLEIILPNNQYVETAIKGDFKVTESSNDLGEEVNE